MVNKYRPETWKKQYLEDYLLKKLENVLESAIKIEGKVPVEESIIRALYQKAPLLDDLALNISETGELVSQMVELVDIKKQLSRSAQIAHSVNSGFSFASLGLYAIEFFRIPAIYMASFILNREIPFSLENNAQWLYSGALLGLSIAAVTVPGVAPFLAIAGAGVALGFEVFFLASFFYNKYQIKKKLAKKKTIIEFLEAELEALKKRTIKGIDETIKDADDKTQEATAELSNLKKIKQEIIKLNEQIKDAEAELTKANKEELDGAEQKLEGLKNTKRERQLAGDKISLGMNFREKFESAVNEDDIDAIFDEMEKFEQNLKEKSENLQSIKNKVAALEKEKEEMGFKSVLDRGVGLVLASAALMGLAVSVFFPPLGVGILIGVSAAAAIYPGLRIATPLFKKMGSWVAAKFNSAVKQTTEEEKLDHSSTDNQAHLDSYPKVRESTAVIFNKVFSGENVVTALETDSHDTHQMAEWDREWEAPHPVNKQLINLTLFSSGPGRVDNCSLLPTYRALCAVSSAIFVFNTDFVLESRSLDTAHKAQYGGLKMNCQQPLMGSVGNFS